MVIKHCTRLIVTVCCNHWRTIGGNCVGIYHLQMKELQLFIVAYKALL